VSVTGVRMMGAPEIARLWWERGLNIGFAYDERRRERSGGLAERNQMVDRVDVNSLFTSRHHQLRVAALPKWLHRILRTSHLDHRDCINSRATVSPRARSLTHSLVLILLTPILRPHSNEHSLRQLCTRISAWAARSWVYH